jgi:two-component system phosphate regulon sensor histidine kinase PhoR
VSEDASSVAASRSWLALAPWICVWLVGLVVAWRFDIQRRRRRSTLSEILRNWRNQITLQTRRFETQTTKTKRLPAFARISNTTEDRDFELEDSAQLIDSTRLFQPLSSDILWLNRSIASQLQTLHQTHQQNERLCTILESMKEGVVSVDNSLQVTLLNTSAQKLLDLRHAEAGSQLVETIRDPRIHSLAKQTLESGLPRTLDLAFGSEPERHVRLRTSLITEETPPFENQSQQSTIKLGVLLIAADITQLIRLEKMRREFTANVSHELKTPLAAIRAYTETLLLGAIDDQENNRRFLNEIDEQSERLESLVADLLELSRIQQASEVSAEPLDVRQLIWNTSTRWKVIASSRQIDFQILDATEDLTIKSDKKSFETVLDNLISNAIRYTNPGGQVIVQSQRTPTETGHAVLISIRDTGIGIPGEDAERIFERFYRVEKARSVALGGTGLGLSIVKNLVSMMGGKITVESEVNVGSTFHVSFPENST